MSSFNPDNLFLERLTEGETNRQLFFRKEKNILGRGEGCDLVLISTIVSRRHCGIDFRNSKMYIRNLEKSANGTFVNDTKIIQETELEEGDNVGFGCNPETLEKNRMKSDWFIYQVKKKSIESFDISSDEEGPNDEIDELCAGIKETTEMLIMKAGEDELVVLSSDEETATDKTWKEKLSQGKSPPRPIRYSQPDLSPESDESMEDPELPVDASETHEKQGIREEIDESFGKFELEPHDSDYHAEEIPESLKQEKTEASDESNEQIKEVCDSFYGVALDGCAEEDVAERIFDLDDAADFEDVVEDHVELDEVYLPSEGDAELIEEVFEEKVPLEVLQEADQETLQERVMPDQDPIENNHGHDEEDEIAVNAPLPDLAIDEIAEDFPLPIDESHGLPPSPPASPDEPLRRLLPARSLSINLERLPISFIEDSLDSSIASDGSLGFSKARKSLSESETEIDSDGSDDIPVMSLYEMKRTSPHSVPMPSKTARRKRKTKQNKNIDNSTSMSAEATPSTSKAARKSVLKKVQSPTPMNFADEGDTEEVAASSLNTSSKGSSGIPSKRKGSKLEKRQRKAKVLKKSKKGDPDERASMESTFEQTAARKWRDEPRRIPKLLFRRQSTTEFTVERVPTDDSFELQNVEKRALTSPSPEAPGSKRAKTENVKKRRSTVCIGNEDEISPSKKLSLTRGPIIIEAQPLRKQRQSPGNPSTSATSPSGMSYQDMFAKAANMRGFAQRRPSVDASTLSPEGRELKEKLAGERKEKLRLLQEEKDRKRKAAEEEKDRNEEFKAKPKTAPSKVKLTEKNRGDFLVNPLPLPPRRLSVTNSPKVPPTLSESKFSTVALMQKLNDFKEKNVIVKPAAVVPEEKAICNNLAFYEAEFDTNNAFAEATPTAGFYKLIESPEPPPIVIQTNEKLTSILKKASIPSTRSNLNFRFEVDENNEIVKHIKEIPNVEGERLALNPTEHLTESVKKKLSLQQYQQRALQPAECQPSTSRSPSCESRSSQQNGSVPSPVSSPTPTESSSSSQGNRHDVLISNEKQFINQILMWKTEWLQSANPQTSIARNERELLIKVASKYQQVYTNANESWEMMTVKEVSILNSKLCEITFITSTDRMPRNYEVGSLLFLRTNISESLGYISRIWRGASQARYMSVHTSFDFAKIQIVVKMKLRYVLDLQAELESMHIPKQINGTDQAISNVNSH